MEDISARIEAADVLVEETLSKARDAGEQLLQSTRNELSAVVSALREHARQLEEREKAMHRDRRTLQDATTVFVRERYALHP